MTSLIERLKAANAAKHQQAVQPAEPAPAAPPVIIGIDAAAPAADETVEHVQPVPEAPEKPAVSLTMPVLRRRAAGALVPPPPPPPAPIEPDVVQETLNNAVAAPKITLPANLQAFKNASAARLASAMQAVTPSVRAAVTSGESYSPQDFLNDMKAIEEEPLEDGDLEGLEVRNKERAAVLVKGFNELQRIFDEELAHLATPQAPAPVITRLSQIVKLSFMRIKEAPGAYAFISLEDKAKLINALRAMADKRQTATKSKKKMEAADYSNGEDAITKESGVVMSDELSALMDNFGFGG